MLKSASPLYPLHCALWVIWSVRKRVGRQKFCRRLLSLSLPASVAVKAARPYPGTTGGTLLTLSAVPEQTFLLPSEALASSPFSAPHLTRNCPDSAAAYVPWLPTAGWNSEGTDEILNNLS